MDERVTLTDEAMTDEPKPKRLSGYDRQKRKTEYLRKDVAALENLVETLLKHLDTAISCDLTVVDRARLTLMVKEIRSALEQDEPEIRATHLVTDG